MASPAGPNTHPDVPLNHIFGSSPWAGWWHFPLVLGLLTTVVIVAAVLVSGPGAPDFVPLGDAAGTTR